MKDETSKKPAEFVGADRSSGADSHALVVLRKNLDGSVESLHYDTYDAGEIDGPTFDLMTRALNILVDRGITSAEPADIAVALTDAHISGDGANLSKAQRSLMRMYLAAVAGAPAVAH